MRVSHWKAGGGRTLFAVCGAHAIQDGLLALQFVLLPLLAQSLGLSYTQVGLLKAASSTSMALLEIPSGVIAERTGEKVLLFAGLCCIGLGYLGVAIAGSFTAALVFFLLAGCGAAFQHALSSSLIIKEFQGTSRRRALGTYNAFGDLGKLGYTGLFGLLLGIGLGLNLVLTAMALSAVAFAFALWFLLAEKSSAASRKSQVAAPLSSSAVVDEAVSASSQGWGITHPYRFLSLGTIVFLDSMVQAAFLTFIAFVLIDKGATPNQAAAGVVLTLLGGAGGKFAGGFIAARLGDRLSFTVIQLLTVIGLFCVIVLPMQWLFLALPLIGVFVQGSSTVSYAAVSDFVQEHKSSRAYAIIYTLSSAAGVCGPFILGVVADRMGLYSVVWSLAAITVLSMLFAVSLYGARRDDLQGANSD